MKYIPVVILNSCVSPQTQIELEGEGSREGKRGRERENKQRKQRVEIALLCHHVMMQY